MKIDISLAQLKVLEAAAAGKLHARIDDPQITASTLHIWRIDGSRAVMLSANALLHRGLIAEATPLPDGRITAAVTELGQALLDELASREPTKEQTNG
jgi:hypothetical protein